MRKTFFLGIHKPCWLSMCRDGFPVFRDVPLFVSARRFRDRKSWPKAETDWALDSGGFSELSLYGGWRTGPQAYVDEVRRWSSQIGRLQWASPQDWMCEPVMLTKTGKTVEQHQALTIENFLILRSIAPELPFIPVLQGWDRDDYSRHVDMYARSGVDLAKFPIVGAGTMCRRQSMPEAKAILEDLHARGLRLHGFGFKVLGLEQCAHLLQSADSMAWSFAARRSEPLDGCDHSSCANCPRYALRWRHGLVGRIGW